MTDSRDDGPLAGEGPPVMGVIIVVIALILGAGWALHHLMGISWAWGSILAFGSGLLGLGLIWRSESWRD